MQASRVHKFLLWISQTWLDLHNSLRLFMLMACCFYGCYSCRYVHKCWELIGLILCLGSHWNIPQWRPRSHRSSAGASTVPPIGLMIFAQRLNQFQSQFSFSFYFSFIFFITIIFVYFFFFWKFLGSETVNLATLTTEIETNRAEMAQSGY